MHEAGAVVGSHVVDLARAAWRRGDTDFRCALTRSSTGNRDIITSVSAEGWYLTTSFTVGIDGGRHPAATMYLFRRRRDFGQLDTCHPSVAAFEPQ